MNDPLVILTRCRDLPLAGLLQSRLESAGIPCFLENQYLVGVNWLYSQAVGGVVLKVLASDLEQARIIIKGEPPDIETPNSDSVHNENGCPKCGSDNIALVRHNRKAGAFSLLLSLPLLFSVVASDAASASTIGGESATVKSDTPGKN